MTSKGSHINRDSSLFIAKPTNYFQNLKWLHTSNGTFLTTV